MNDRTLVLHAGPHKTGSTYLQHRLNKARGALAGQFWSYPDYAIANNSHYGVYSWLTGTSTSDTVNEESFRAMVAKQTQFILSCEDFIYLSKEKLLKLKSYLDGFNVQVILYIRSPVDLWPSHWQELVRHGRDLTLLEYVSAHAGWTSALESAIMDPLVQANKFTDVFGHDSLRMFCYENIMDAGGDLFEHFWTDILRLSAPAPFEAPRTINPSQPADKIEMLRCLNELYADKHDDRPGTKILSAYQKRQSEIEALPRYASFKQELTTRSTIVKLNSGQEFFRVRENRFFAKFGSRVENPAAPNKLFARPQFERKIPYMARYWICKFGYLDFVREIFGRLEI